MGDTKIQWANKVWNCVRGCSRISPGCGGKTGEGSCYAERHASRFCGTRELITGKRVNLPFYGYATNDHGPRWTGLVTPLPDNLSEPLRWKKPARIFVNSMSDLFHKDVPFEYIAAVFGVMALCPQHTFLVLTKRADVMAEWFKWVDAQDAAGGSGRNPWTECVVSANDSLYENNDKKGPEHPEESIGPLDGPWPLPNVHLGVSAENQKYADERIPLLLQCPAAVHWVSVEPQLGPVSLEAFLPFKGLGAGCIAGCGGGIHAPNCRHTFIRWCVDGGESGPGARPFNVAWARALRDECMAAGIPWFFKQMGAYCISDSDDDRRWVGDMMLPHPFRIRTRGGGKSQEQHPEDIRIQEYPVTP